MNVEEAAREYRAAHTTAEDRLRAALADLARRWERIADGAARYERSSALRCCAQELREVLNGQQGST